jgi:hypothetical protein
VRRLSAVKWRRQRASGWHIRHIDHLHNDAIAAGSDHAAAVADLDLTPGPGQY